MATDNADLEIELDTSEIEALIREIPGFNFTIFAEMRKAMKEALDVLHAEITARTPVNTGTLRQSIQPVIRGQAPSFVGEVGSPLIYGWPVERGRRPGKMPPVDAIELWVNRKLGLQGNEAKSVAFLVARAIGRRGTRGEAMFFRGTEAARPRVEQIWNNVPSRARERIEAKLAQGLKR